LESLYSKAVFNEVTDTGSSFDLIKRYASDDWVLGKSSGWIGDPARIRNQVVEIYEHDYIDAWDRVLNDLELAQPQSAAELTTALGTLTGPESPLRNLVATIVDNTRLERAVAPESTGILASAKRTVESATKSIQGAAGLTPAGRRVSAHFQPYHRLVEGELGKTPIDRVIAALAQLRSDWDRVVASGEVSRARENPALRETTQLVRSESQLLPPALRALTDQLTIRLDGEINKARGIADTVIKNAEEARLKNIDALYRQQVLPECNRIVAGRYPFTRGSDNDLPLRDFAKLFGPEGIFDNFFKTHLASEIDISSTPWRYQTPDARTQLSGEMLRVFEDAAEVRDVFFTSGSLKMNFTLRLQDYDQAAATRFRMDLEGQPLDSQQRNQGYAFQWPGPKGGFVEVLFDGRFATPYRAPYHGAWAWFRLLEHSKLTRESDTRNILTVSVQGIQARLAIEAATVHNPFATPVWQRFKCGS
jgi:type VI secretion system protein ImpL